MLNTSCDVGKLLQQSFINSKRSELSKVTITALWESTAFDVDNGFLGWMPSDLQLMLVPVGHACYDVKIATTLKLRHLTYRQHDGVGVEAP